MSCSKMICQMFLSAVMFRPCIEYYLLLLFILCDFIPNHLKNIWCESPHDWDKLNLTVCVDDQANFRRALLHSGEIYEVIFIWK
jgi:hypothetical protein